MPLPTPTPSEKKGGTKGKNAFVSRCVSMIHNEYPNNKQAVAICLSQYRNSKRKSSGTFDHLENDKLEILD